MRADCRTTRRFSRGWASAIFAALLLVGTAVVAADKDGAAAPSATRVRETLLFARQLRPMIAEFYVSYMRFPSSMQEIGSPTPPSSVRTRVTPGGAVEFQFGGDAAGGPRIYLVPHLETMRIRWQCVSPDIASLPSLDPECAYVAGFSPPALPPLPVAAAPPSRKLSPQELIVHSSVRGERVINPVRYYRSLPWDATGDFPRLFAELTDEDKRAVITLAIEGNAGQFKDFAEVLLFSTWLSTAGPTAIPFLDAGLADRHPDSSAAALAAICEIERKIDASGQYADCFDRRGHRADGARAYLVEAATRSIENPPPGYRACAARFLELLGAMGSASRPAIPTLAAQLDASAESPGEREPCPRGAVADTLLDILGAGPVLETDGRVVHSAVNALLDDALVIPRSRRADSNGAPPGSRRQAVLDRWVWTKEMQGRLDAIFAEQMRNCDGLGPASDVQIARLGKLGFRVVNQFLNRPKAIESSGCVNQGTAARALAALLAQYPAEAGRQYARLRSALARDLYIAAALDAIEIDAGHPDVETPVGKRLGDFVRETGYVAPIAREGVPLFPDNPELRWTPLVDWTLSVPARDNSAAVVPLPQSLKRLAARYPGCAVPPEDESLVRKASAGKTLAIIDCDDNYSGPIVVIGSPRGFKAMRFPARLSHMQQAPRESIVAVGTVTDDDTIVLLVQEPCYGHWRNCEAEGDPPYDLVAEDGDWFIYLRARP
jgi:hypothetical protein